MKKKNNKTKSFEIPVYELREMLRKTSVELSEKLAHSVARQTSYDLLPCTEYGEEVRRQYVLTEKLFYIQYCRDTLERCISDGKSSVTYRRKDRSSITTTFTMTTQHKVRVTNFADVMKGR